MIDINNISTPFYNRKKSLILLVSVIIIINVQLFSKIDEKIILLMIWF